MQAACHVCADGLQPGAKPVIRRHARLRGDATAGLAWVANWTSAEDNPCRDDRPKCGIVAR
jgi:hypothetical protein